MKVTQKKLAEILGVDRSTISKALAGHPGISEPQRQRIKALSDEMNYVPDYHGRTLSTGRTNIVSITRGYLAMDELSAARIWHFQQAAEVKGMRIRLDSFDDALVSIHENSCDGVIVLQPPSLAGPLGQVYRELDTPVIFTDCSLGDDAATCVCPDWAGGARLAVEHLVSLGHERICFAGLVKASIACGDRYSGYTEVLAKAGLSTGPELFMEFGDWPGDVRDMEEYAGAIIRAMDSGCTAFFCASDLIAAGIIRVLSKQGVRVPHEVSVTGYDDSTTAKVVFPSITSVNQNFTEIAVQALDLLQELLETGESPEPRRTVECKLTVRESTGPKPQGC